MPAPMFISFLGNQCPLVAQNGINTESPEHLTTFLVTWLRIPCIRQASKYSTDCIFSFVDALESL